MKIGDELLWVRLGSLWVGLWVALGGSWVALGESPAFFIQGLFVFRPSIMLEIVQIILSYEREMVKNGEKMGWRPYTRGCYSYTI